MIRFIEILLNYLSSSHPRVYFQRAPKKVESPYIVFDLPNAFNDGEGHKVITVDIDGWSVSEDADLEDLMENINNALDKTTLSSDDIVVTFHLDSILSLSEDDPRVLRWKYIYQARLFERS